MWWARRYYVVEPTGCCRPPLSVLLGLGGSGGNNVRHGTPVAHEEWAVDWVAGRAAVMRGGCRPAPSINP